MNSISLIRADIENEFDRINRDINFSYALMEQNREMEDFINKSIIIASGNKYAINEMVIINEAAAGDKIKGFFEKIKNFFKKIFDKLGASMNALFAEQKKYIEKYQYIITKCKYQAGDVNDVYNHFNGITRILDVIDNADTAILSTNVDKYCKGSENGGVKDDSKFIDMKVFESAKSIEEFDLNKIQTVKPEEQKAKSFDEFVAGGYWASIKEGFVKETDANGNNDPNESFKAYFNGSKDTISWSTDEVESNMQTIINVVYAGQSYLTKLEKVVTTVQRKMDEISKNMEDYYKAQKDKIIAATKNTAKPEDKTPEQAQETKDADKVKQAEEQAKKEANAKEAEDKSPEAAKKREEEARLNGNDESYRYSYRNNETILSEMNIGSSSSSNSEQKGASVTGAGVQNTNAASKANENISKQTVNKQQAQDVTIAGVDDSNKDEISKKAEEILTKDINNRQAEVNADVMVSTSITTNMFNSFKLINKDFFSILQAHVQWYLSNPGAEKQSENQTTRTHNLDMNATTGTVSKNAQPTTAAKPAAQPTAQPAQPAAQPAQPAAPAAGTK
jgi:hypothetical protein